jgi:hypothetical protein
MSLVEKHVLTDGEGGAIFMFNPEKYVTESEDGVKIIINEDVKVIDFLALMRQMDLENSWQNAEALVIALLEKRGSEEVQDYA